MLLPTIVSPLAQAQAFHSSPECWAAPRVYHSPLPPELHSRVHIISAPGDVAPPGKALAAPNSRFRYWVREVSPTGAGGAGLVIDSGGPEHTVMLFEGVPQSPAPQWVSNSLLFVRIPWGRVVSSDLVFDIDSGQVIYHEAAIDGFNAWQQYREACFARCPCAEPSVLQSHAFSASYPASTEIVGLLEMPGVFHSEGVGGVNASDNPVPAVVYSAPAIRSRILLETVRPGDLEYREYGYESGAAAVYERLDGWFRVKLAGGGPYGWIAPKGNTRRFHAVSDLLQNRLNYLTAHWDGLLWGNPPAGNTSEGQARPSIRHGYQQRNEYPATVTDTRETDSGLWLKVRIPRVDPCSPDGDDSTHGMNNVLEEGWVPAYSAGGMLTTWFYARGC